MRVSVCLGAILIPEYLDFHLGYSPPRSRIAGIYSYSGISQTNAPLVKKLLSNTRVVLFGSVGFIQRKGCPFLRITTLVPTSFYVSEEKAYKLLEYFIKVTESCLNRRKTNAMRSIYFKVAGNSFQYFLGLRIWWVIITILYRLTPKSWYQQTAQSSGNKLLLILWHNRFP